MGFLNNLKSNTIRIAAIKKPMSANSINLMAFADDAAFNSELNVAKLAIIEEYESESGMKKTYLVEAEIAEQLDPKHFTVKNLHILVSMAGEIRIALLSDMPTNSWNRSKLAGLVAASRGNAVSFKRDKLSKVYTWTIHCDIEAIEIDMAKVDAVLTETFVGEFTISSMEHPVIKKLLEKDESVDVVDVDSLKDDSDSTVDVDAKTESTQPRIHPEFFREGSDLDLPEDFDVLDEDGIELDLDALEIEEITI
ncbi:hypothetical protein AB4158_24385 [Vibrio splendidus]|uniref:hypothetical protein n=1 Tax=Vibrio crassostreae TaxID=246167 RepID=UPI00352FBD2D